MASSELSLKVCLLPDCVQQIINKFLRFDRNELRKKVFERSFKMHDALEMPLIYLHSELNLNLDFTVFDDLLYYKMTCDDFHYYDNIEKIYKLIKYSHKFYYNQMKYLKFSKKFTYLNDLKGNIIKFNPRNEELLDYEEKHYYYLYKSLI